MPFYPGCLESCSRLTRFSSCWMELVQFEQRTPKNLTQSAANEIDLYSETRHARPCAGHPLLGFTLSGKDIDGRDKPGRDEKASRFQAVSESLKILAAFGPSLRCAIRDRSNAACQRCISSGASGPWRSRKLGVQNISRLRNASRRGPQALVWLASKPVAQMPSLN